jgi:trimeric autotransporter adhesin
MKRTISLAVLLLVLTASLFAQSGSINNALGTGGTFNIKSGTDTLLSLSQSNGYLSLNRSLTLSATNTDSTLGVIFKGTNRFIHNYQALGTNGKNIFVGVNAGNFTMSGSGSQASGNTALGNSSLSSLTIGFWNSALGFDALYSNTTGGGNSAFGFQSLALNTQGSYNSAFGWESLHSNTMTSYNSAFGPGSLLSNTADANSAFGYYSLSANTTGGGNSAFGYYALCTNTAGYSNSAFGYQSLYHSTGNDNTALGDSAGYNLTTGSNNIIIGYNAEPSTTVISNEITLGNSSITKLRCAVTSITALSDARDKKNIRDLPLGLDFLMNVKPRQFNWDRRDWYENRKPDGSKMQATPTAGFIAQELDEVQTKEGAEWLNLVLKSNPDRLEATPGNLLPVMVKAIQELKSENDALKAENDLLKDRFSRFERAQQLLVSEIEKIRSDKSRKNSDLGSTR